MILQKKNFFKGSIFNVFYLEDIVKLYSGMSPELIYSNQNILNIFFNSRRGQNSKLGFMPVRPQKFVFWSLNQFLKNKPTQTIHQKKGLFKTFSEQFLFFHLVN